LRVEAEWLQREKTVIGNLREDAKRLAPGRACISVVSDHGFVKDWFVFAFIPAEPRPQNK
jgi:hypothetical protein